MSTGHLNAAPVELLDADRHLLGRADQECARESDGVGVHLDRLFDDRVDRDLFSQVEDGVAVVGQDGVHQRLADVMHVAVHRGQHHACPLVYPSCFFKELTRGASPPFSWPRRICSTNGRMSSPAPNLSPTSFMAGNRTLLSTRYRTPRARPRRRGRLRSLPSCDAQSSSAHAASGDMPFGRISAFTRLLAFPASFQRLRRNVRR